MTTAGASRSDAIPQVLAGPILRRVSEQRLALWVAAREPVRWRLKLTVDGDDQPLLDRPLTDAEHTKLRFGGQLRVYLLDVELTPPLPRDQLIHYNLGLQGDGENSHHWHWIAEWAPHLCLPGHDSPNFILKQRLDRVFHGSCRRPHHPAGDGLARVDLELQNSTPEQRPALLMLTGDQIYADDVAGPMLHACHEVIRRLELPVEPLPAEEPADSEALRLHPYGFYHRDDLLPHSEFNEAVTERFFGGVRKPVFTSASAGNHLITLAEVMAMYLLVWSPRPWELVDDHIPVSLPRERDRYLEERQTLQAFRQTLPQAARALAHLPSYMIFDDHDITDDWNLSALWESTAYEHPFSRRIIGNALVGYLVNQAWGNTPERFGEHLKTLNRLLANTRDGRLDAATLDQLIDALLASQQWHYTLDTTPPLVVLDTRTRRWRSEVSRARPSGLMDWEALTEFQHELIGRDSVIVVSPAPVFGVKLIEVIQAVFTWFGQPLMVDAENWMAHRGAASVLLNIFRHSRTPANFVLLSGDVHYSFVYDVRLRHRPDAPRIWQITSSGLKNQFPGALLDWLDRINRWLYASWSPLNWFTKRRRMRIRPRSPRGRSRGERLWNGAGIGEVCLDASGQPRRIRQLGADGRDTEFDAPTTDARQLGRTSREST